MPAPASKNLGTAIFLLLPAAPLLRGDEGNVVVFSSFFVNSVVLLVIAQWMTV
jgi:hypothetical protein